MKRIAITLASVALVLGGIAGSAVMGYRAYQESERNKAIAEEIRSLEDEANRVDQENRNLSDRIEYLQSDAFHEREAKRVLEYQKSGEKVVVIRERADATKSVSGDSDDSSASDHSSAVGASDDTEANPLKWWREFFGNSSQAAPASEGV